MSGLEEAFTAGIMLSVLTLGTLKSCLEIRNQRGVTMMESENELTSVEVVLHNFNRIAIDKFLQNNGLEIEGYDWGPENQTSFTNNR